MIRRFEIEGFKSIGNLALEPGRVTVLIGENGCGKSNILEAIAFAGAGAAGLLSHEFMEARNIRMPPVRFMRPAFAERAPGEMRMTVSVDDEEPTQFRFEVEDGVAPHWYAALSEERGDRHRMVLNEAMIDAFKRIAEQISSESFNRLLETIVVKRFDDLERFVVYAPEYSALRDFHRGGQILPVGIRGEGLFAHLKEIRDGEHAECLTEISRRLQLIDWFDGFEVPADLAAGERRLAIRDRYLDPTAYIDQRSANEGFLFLLFYYTLLISPYTPRFFAIDNIDASLNPRLCARLMRDLAALAKAGDKQVIVTTHNPAVLDGLDLRDDDQRLLVVSRTLDGPTRIRRVMVPEPVEGAPPINLSEAFIRGYLGGLPDNF
ncbi:MAG: AAA family ATPase [Myxococcales bacterium]|nr:AAA family ATPase [Myxococcales bacterium]